MNTCGDCYHCKVQTVHPGHEDLTFIGCALSDDYRAIVIAQKTFETKPRLAALKFLNRPACKDGFDNMHPRSPVDGWRPSPTGAMRIKIDKWIARRTAENARNAKVRVEAKAEKGCQRLSGRPGTAPEEKDTPEYG